MSTMVPHDRYPGVRPFDDDPVDHRLFFGRDHEVDALFHQVLASKLVVLLMSLIKTGMVKLMTPMVMAFQIT